MEMMKNKRQITFLSFCMVIITLVATLVGLLSSQVHTYPDMMTSFGETIQLYQKGLYARDSVSMASQAIAQDYVTLILGIPLLLSSLYFFRKKNTKGLIFLTGTVGYFLYTYSSYAFLLIYNRFYLVYVLLMTLSFYTFILCMMALKACHLKEQFNEKYPLKSLVAFLIGTGVMLGGQWMGRLAPTFSQDVAPYGLEHYSTLGIQTLDLGFVIPASFVAAYFLIKKNEWGYLLSSVLVIKAITMASAISAMVIGMQLNGVEVSLVEKLLFPCLGLLGFAFMFKILSALKV